MDKVKKIKFSLISFSSALISFFLTTLAFEAYKSNDHIHGIFWPYLVKLTSYFKSNREEKSLISETSLISLTDERIIQLMLFISILLALISVFIGIQAKRKNENSLYYASSIIAGLVCLIYSVKIYLTII